MPKRNLNDALIERFVAEELALQHMRRPAAKLLDLGCGDLRYRKYEERAGWSCLFADFDVRSKGVNVRMDAHRLPFKNESFDLVLATEVLEHLAEPHVCLKEVYRVLQPGGEVILTIPFIWGMHEVPYDFYRYTEFGIDRMLRDASFELLFVQRRGDFIGVALALSAHFFSNTAEIIRRTVFLRPVGWALIGLGRLVGPLVTATYIKLCGGRILQRHDCLGAALKGVGGQLNAWPLGFHVVARRPKI